MVAAALGEQNSLKVNDENLSDSIEQEALPLSL
jgi:hypothetical protein